MKKSCQRTQNKNSTIENEINMALKIHMQIKGTHTGYHVRKGNHLHSAVNLDHHNMKVTNQYRLH